MEVPPTSGDVVGAFDPSRPFRGVVLCCTNIEADQRSEIAQRISDMGGVHKYDLTLDVTHLIVGDYNTPKYRHVAKERPDIKPMAAGWIEAVRRLWVEDQEMDFAALEEQWKLRTFESAGHIPNSPLSSEHEHAHEHERERPRLVCCLTGFEDNNVRAMIEHKVNSNGGIYVADLSRRVTHLIVAKPEGKKYAAARRWDVRCVTIEWLHDSVERGMILNEACYDPTLPPEEIGKDAWSRRDTRQIILGKRSREGSAALSEAGRRKLRKSASMRMNSQNNDIWGDILNQSAGEPSRPDRSSTPATPVLANSVSSDIENSRPKAQPAIPSIAPQSGNITWPAADKGVFTSCRFYVYGFPEPKKQVLLNFLTSHGGQLSSSLVDGVSLGGSEPLSQRYLLVPQASPPNSYPEPPDDVHVVTEFFIERCIHNKTLFSPTDHVLGRPFSRFPIEAFRKLTICTAGFVNEQLNQVEKTVTQLGATYSEKLNRQVTLLLCPDLRSLREQKRDLAVYHNIPVINVEWLWQCITKGSSMSWEPFQFQELARSADSIRADLKRREEDKKKGKETPVNQPIRPEEPAITKPPVDKPSRRNPAPPAKAGVDITAFDGDNPDVNHEPSNTSHTSSTRKTPREMASAHRPGFDGAFASGPLSETRVNDLNKSTSSPKQQQIQPPSEDTCHQREAEVGDSEAGEESDTPTPRTYSKEPSGCADTDADADADAEEAERKRLAQQAKDLERRELSKRLNSLMANDEMTSPPPREDNNNNSNNDSLESLPSAPPRPTRRKRQVLGRAASNVSAASSMSAESAAPTWDTTTAKTKQAGSTISASGGGSEFEKFLEEEVGDGNMGAEESGLPSTQLEYDNPEARRQRQVVLERIMGTSKQASTSTGESERSDQTKKGFRLADFVTASSGAAVVKRNMRRRGTGSGSLDMR
ncbi:hypothetical protein GGR50DRAFT_658680 [Xylaria sp. CBS 124048]|nr:hypothetical protein GGR50DRAFT_658680 [Xylaria sp. CBS 124048]